VPLEHVVRELQNWHPTSSGNMDDAKDLHMLLSDRSMHSDLPSMVWCYVAVGHVLLKEASFKGSDSGDLRGVPLRSYLLRYRHASSNVPK
jgi:hypothetical protein